MNVVGIGEASIHDTESIGKGTLIVGEGGGAMKLLLISSTVDEGRGAMKSLMDSGMTNSDVVGSGCIGSTNKK